MTWWYARRWSEYLLGVRFSTGRAVRVEIINFTEDDGVADQGAQHLLIAARRDR